MATVMDVQARETASFRRVYFSPIRWGAVFAAIVSGTGSYLLLTLLGVAVGLTAVDPNAATPVGRVPMATGIWTGISLLISAFIGSYIAGRMSGLSRASDGLLHGFVSWAAATLFYVFLATSAIGAVLGGTFSAVSAVAQTGAQAAGGAPNVLSSITGGKNIDAQTVRDLQQAVQSGNRDQAVNIMAQNLGMTQETAGQAYDRVAPLLQQGGDRARDAATRATQVLKSASWWLFAGLLLSLALGLLGGVVGVRGNAGRLIADHTAERRVRPATMP